MDTLCNEKELFIDLIKKGHDMSSMYTLPQVINIECSELDIRGVSHPWLLCRHYRFEKLLRSESFPARF